MVISLNHSNVVNVVCGRPRWLAAAFEGREEALAHRVGVRVAGRSHRRLPDFPSERNYPQVLRSKSNYGV